MRRHLAPLAIVLLSVPFFIARGESSRSSPICCPVQFTVSGDFHVVSPPVFISWVDDEHWLTAHDSQLRLVEAVSGKERAVDDLHELAALAPALNAAQREDLAQHAAEVVAVQKAGTLQGREYAFLYSPTGGGGPFQQVNQMATTKDLTAVSPDGKWTALNRRNDLYVVEKESKKETRLTKDGSEVIFNGRADAVYQEEIFFPGRSLNAFWWSPDSKHLAFFRLDDTNVPRFTILDHTQRVQTPEITTYPKAGQPNPILKVGIAHVADGSITWVDLDRYDPKDLLACRTVGWMPDGKEVYFYAQNRTQTWLDLCAADVQTGKLRVLFRDQTKAWIRDNGVIGPIKFQGDGSFLWNSERSGFTKVYHYTADGQLIGALAQGDWDVQQVNAIDEVNGWVYFSANKDNMFGSHTYRIKLDGTGLESLNKDPESARTGTHEVQFSPTAKYFVDEWSAYSTGPQMTLHWADGSRIRTVATTYFEQDAKQKAELKSGFFKIKTPDEGVFLPATVQLPPDFDPAKKYPVWLQIYGGPHMPQVKDTAAGGKGGGKGAGKAGYIMFRMDPRASSPTPHLSWACYKQLGVQELKDVEITLHWLIDNYPCVDPKRIGISGHSHGGFMSAYALTHSKMFAAGVDNAGPTDWRNYNSFYVDRYMTTPDENPKGYEAASVVAAAKNLHGKLLIMHGMMDDNVHVTSAIQLIDALEKANLPFEMMLYPKGRHGIGGNFQQVQNEFMQRVLRPE
jgi:dipeptidyl-peptidase 4